ncbi:hypothetical protein PR048_001661 [Dryococelus australis]|uniref:Uncharacterized protein n=1 Tax=Dryococelus australis TaxID=614101 RepID=A0ABQ9IIP3_9NEOP|nr:hypothetical protein PR048_001661 [Dryococelus australis]
MLHVDKLFSYITLHSVQIGGIIFTHLMQPFLHRWHSLGIWGLLFRHGKPGPERKKILCRKMNFHGF